MSKLTLSHRDKTERKRYWEGLNGKQRVNAHLDKNNCWQGECNKPGMRLVELLSASMRAFRNHGDDDGDNRTRHTRWEKGRAQLNLGLKKGTIGMIAKIAKAWASRKFKTRRDLEFSPPRLPRVEGQTFRRLGVQYYD